MIDSLRRMRALMVGMVVAFAISLMVENVVYRAYPPGEGFTVGDPEAMGIYVATLADGGFVLMIIGWAFSAFVGGLIACLFGRQDLPRLVGVVTFAVLAGSVTNFVMVDYPSWVTTSAVFATLLSGLGTLALARRMGLDRKPEATKVIAPPKAKR
jgi:hypothetical protein